MKKLIQNRGSALLTILALMAIISMVAISAVDQATTDMDISYNQLHKDQAFYIAEAGLKHAIAKISANPIWDSGFVDYQYGDGSFTVSFIDSNVDTSLYDTIVLRSYATLHDSKSGVETWIVPLQFNPFQYAMYGDSAVNIQNSMITDSYNSDSGSYAATVIADDGSVGSNGDVVIKNGATVSGDAITSDSGALSINPGSIVTGDTTSTAPEHDLELIPQSEYDWAEANSVASTGISGNYTYDPFTKEFTADRGGVVLSDGVYFFSSIELASTAELSIAPGANVTIYVTGDIELKNSGDINAGGTPSDLIINSQGDLILKNSGTISAVFYCPEGSADLRNSSDFYGSVVANDILAHNSAGFHYDRELLNYKRKSTKYKEQIAWKEIDY